MKTLQSSLGQLQIGSLESIFRAAIGLIEASVSQNENRLCRIAFSGGSTPKAFYEWAIKTEAFSQKVLEKILWTNSDERCVPLSNEESNFGNLDRFLLQALKVAEDHKLPWPVDKLPQAAAAFFQDNWEIQFGSKAGLDLCFLGMGEDGHTASLFPHCSLIGQKELPDFSAVEWPGRGWRLTITETALERAELIVVLVSGASKAERLKAIVKGPVDPHEYPIQILQAFASKVIWLIDEEAAAKLT